MMNLERTGVSTLPGTALGGIRNGDGVYSVQISNPLDPLQFHHHLKVPQQPNEGKPEASSSYVRMSLLLQHRSRQTLHPRDINSTDLEGIEIFLCLFV